ncbi:5'-nucleotidase-like isoform X2 [Pollicipes pollicipes]|nr:5'-nucleotidase-like isoform X2 [Pollicipes pollicipes]
MFPSRALLLLLAACFVTCELDITILHNNDIHAHFDPVSATTGECKDSGQCYGGIGRLVHAVNTYKQNVPHTLMLYGGDIFQGHKYYTMFKWHVAADMINRVQYDAMALGNHEFDDGLTGLLPYMDNVSHPLVCTNIDFGPHASPITALCRSSIIRQIGDHMVGIMGFTTVETPELASVARGIRFVDEIEALQAEALRLQKQGAQIIIAAGHSGYIREKEMAEKIDGIDVIVGGHSHSLLYSGEAPHGNPVEGPYPTVVLQPSGRTVLVVQAYQYGKYLGVLNVTFDGDGEVQSWSGQPVVLDGPEDQEAMEALQKYRDLLHAEEAKVIATSLVHLSGDRADCRQQECNIGNLITDGMLRAVLQPYESGWSKVTAAICQGGGIRQSIRKGNVSEAQIKAVQPFGNMLDVLLVTGDTLWKAFEHSASAHDEIKGGFLQISGLRVLYDLSKPLGSRVQRLEIACSQCSVPKLEPVLRSRQYRVAMPGFLAGGGDGYDMFDKEKLYHLRTGLTDVDVFVNQVKRMSPVITGVEGRIFFVCDGSTSSIWC